MKKIYCAQIQRQVYVLAESEKEARRVGRHQLGGRCSVFELPESVLDETDRNELLYARNWCHTTIGAWLDREGEE